MTLFSFLFFFSGYRFGLNCDTLWFTREAPWGLQWVASAVLSTAGAPCLFTYENFHVSSNLLFFYICKLHWNYRDTSLESSPPAAAACVLSPLSSKKRGIILVRTESKELVTYLSVILPCSCWRISCCWRSSGLICRNCLCTKVCHRLLTKIENTLMIW